MYSLSAMGQVVRTSEWYNNKPDTTSIYCNKHAWNLSRIVNAMKWIERYRNYTKDSVTLSKLDKEYSKLKGFCDSQVNYALLDKPLSRIDSTLNKVWKDDYQRNSPYGFIQKELLCKKPDETDKLILKGLKMFEENKRDSAYLYFKNAVENAPDRLDNYYFVIKDELEFTRDTTKALRYLNKLIKCSGGKSIYNFKPYLARAYVYLEKAQYRLAFDDVNQLLVKDSTDQEALRCRILIKEELKDYAGSISDNQIILKLHQTKSIPVIVDSASAFNSIGWNYYLLKQYELCVQYADSALQLSPDCSLILDTRGSGYFGLEKYEKCIDDMTKAIQIEPNEANSWYLRGLSFLKLNRKDLGYCDISKAALLGLADAVKAMKDLSIDPLNKDIENQRQFNRKPINNKNSVFLDGNGLHFMLR